MPKALTNIIWGDEDGNRKHFNVGDDVEGIPDDDLKELQSSGAVGSDEELAAAQGNLSDAERAELNELRARLTELESKTGVEETSPGVAAERVQAETADATPPDNTGADTTQGNPFASK